MTRVVIPADIDIAQAGALIKDLEGPALVATHQNPDGDAIGSALALTRVLRARGHDVVLWHPWRPGVPEELEFLLHGDEQIVHELPDDVAVRTLFAVDCATAMRLSADVPPGALAGRVVNIDHHHDNGRYGDLNLVDGAMSSTAELLVSVFDAAGVALDTAIAEPLYVGLVTDTGRLSYSNTSPATLRTAARLVETGLETAELARRLYENADFAQLRLAGLAVGRARALLDGRLVVATLSETDFAEAGTDNADGIAEMLRGVRGAKVGALVRSAGHGVRASLRAADESVDVSAIARLQGGGGHTAAAGVSSPLESEAFVQWLTDQVRAQLDG